MDVIFRRTGRSRYAVQVEPRDHPVLTMDPAPGWDDVLPHDLVHFAVEKEFGLALGVYGQLASGGNAGSFRLPPASTGSRDRTRAQRRGRRKGERLAGLGREDGERSERLAAVCHQLWLGRSSHPARRREALRLAPYAEKLRHSLTREERSALSGAAGDRIVAHLDTLSERWRSLPVGGSMRVTW